MSGRRLANTISFEENTVPNRNRANTAFTKKRRPANKGRVNAMPCQHDVVSARRPVKNGVVSTRSVVNTTPCQDDAV